MGLVRKSLANAMVGTLPVVVAAALAAWAYTVRHAPEPPDYRLWSTTDGLLPIYAQRVEQLQDYFARRGYDWPLSACGEVPPIAAVALPDDLAQVPSVAERKGFFVRLLLPMVLAENADIRRQRELLIKLIARGAAQWSVEEHRFAAELLEWYRVPGNIADYQTQSVLLRRVDALPAPLVLAQAANESAWGTSRFAREGNNLFGMWTYDESSGLIPVNRPLGMTYAVQSFPSLQASIRAYMRLLNTGSSYRTLREIRDAQRRAGHELQALRLADGLLRYSERGTSYVDDIKAMIRSSKLASLGAAELRRRNALVEAYWQPVTVPATAVAQSS